MSLSIHSFFHLLSRCFDGHYSNTFLYQRSQDHRRVSFTERRMRFLVKTVKDSRHRFDGNEHGEETGREDAGQRKIELYLVSLVETMTSQV